MKEKFKKWLKTPAGKIVIGGLLLIIAGLCAYQFYFKNQFLFAEREEKMLKAAMDYFERYPRELPKENSYREMSITELYETNYLETLYVPSQNRICDENSFVRVIATEEGYTYLVSLICGKYKSKVDRTPPEITLKGDTSIVLSLGSVYQELGVESVKDNEDELSISDIEIDSSNLDTSKVGNYTITYKVYDKNYNLAMVKREVTVAETLAQKITSKKGANYVFQGNVHDNYVLFSGMLFRIVRVNSDNTILLVSENNISNVAYQLGTEAYPESNLYDWLNNYFYSKISKNSQAFISDTTWCYDSQAVAEMSASCNNSVNAKIGILSVTDFLNSRLGTTSYLLDNSNFTLLNQHSYGKVWITDSMNSLGLTSVDSDMLSGIRPALTLIANTYAVSGDGTESSPYKLQDYAYGKESEKLSTRLIGEYVIYSDYRLRISDILEDGSVELTSVSLLRNQTTGEILTGTYHESVETVPNSKEDGNLYYQLNNELIHNLSEALLVNREYIIPMQDTSKKTTERETTKMEGLLSIPASYEMFSGYNRNYGGEAQMYWLSDYKNGNIAILNGSNALAFELSRSTYPSSAVKFKITLNNNTTIASGKGTVNEPYYVR